MSGSSSDTAAVIEASGESTLERATKKAQETINQFFNTSLNVAVTGSSGSGKSTFINRIRGLSDKDEGAAKTGVTETTTEPTPYEHPTMSNVKFWDLPGIGTSKYPAKKYIKEMKFSRFDFFIIISSERFTEHDIMLAKEIQKQKKKFYFIRSKIDNDIRSEEENSNFNREETLSEIREDCLKKLKDFKNYKVFLINCKNLNEFDFEKLLNTLMSELPEHQLEALILSVPVTSVSVLKEKVRRFERAAWAAATVSGVIGPIPVPGLSLACDTSILVTFFTTCYHSFGLDDKSLDKLSERVNKPHLKNLIMSDLVKELVSKSTVRLGGAAAVEFLCSLVPGVGSIAAAGISFALTLKLLKEGLKELEREALKVLREAGLE